MRTMVWRNSAMRGRLPAARIVLARNPCGLAVLPHELVVRPAEDDVLDLGQLVPRRDDEDLRIRPRPFVRLQIQLESEAAVEVRALAQELVDMPVLPLPEGGLLDPLVDLPEQPLVLGQAALTFVHDGSLPETREPTLAVGPAVCDNTVRKGDVRWNRTSAMQFA